jgi:hypothetical protein
MDVLLHIFMLLYKPVLETGFIDLSITQNTIVKNKAIVKPSHIISAQEASSYIVFVEDDDDWEDGEFKYYSDDFTPKEDYILENKDNGLSIIFSADENNSFNTNSASSTNNTNEQNEPKMLSQQRYLGFNKNPSKNGVINSLADAIRNPPHTPHPSHTSEHCNYCKNVEGSLYCSIHMNCSTCGFNRRFKNCSAHDQCKTDGKYKLLVECYELGIHDDGGTGGCYVTDNQQYLNFNNITRDSLILKKSVNTLDETSVLCAHETYGIQEGIIQYGIGNNMASNGIIPNDIITRRKYLSILDIARTQQYIIASINDEFNNLRKKFDELRYKLDHALTMQKRIDDIAHN